MHQFAFDSSRYNQIRNKSFLRGLLIYACLLLFYFTRAYNGTSIDFNQIDTKTLLLIAIYIGFMNWLNERNRNNYNAIQIIIDETSITHIEADKDQATIYFKDIKSITQSNAGLYIQTIYPASSLTVLAQMQGYNQIIALLSAVKPIKKQTILSRNFWVAFAWPATVISFFIFKDFFLQTPWAINAVLAAGVVGVAIRFYHLQTSPYVTKNDKWASYGLVVVAIIVLAILAARLAG